MMINEGIIIPVNVINDTSLEPIAEVPKVVTPTKVGVQNLLIILNSLVRWNYKTYEYTSFAIGSLG
jgi:hypothetical protein